MNSRLGVSGEEGKNKRLPKSTRLSRAQNTPNDKITSICNVMCRVINAIYCQVWFSSLKLKGYHVVASCAFFFQSNVRPIKAPSATFRFLTRANVPLSTNRLSSWRLVGETFQWNISSSKAHEWWMLSVLFEALARFCSVLISRIRVSWHFFRDVILGEEG